MNPLILAAFLLTVDPAMPATIPIEQCKPMDEVVGGLARSGVTLRRLSPDATMRAAAFYNSQPPASDFKFDTGFYAVAPNGTGMIHLGNGPILCAGFTLPPQQWRVIGPIILGVNA